MPDDYAYSGRKKNSIMVANAEIHIKIRIGHCQPLFIAAKPAMTGPKTGPHTAPIAHEAIAYGTCASGHISIKVAPPVASAGDPMNPVRNRKTMIVSMFLA